MTTYNSPSYAARQPQQAHGEVRATSRMHDTIALPATLTTGDTINIGALPRNAVVTGLTLKTSGQLDASGSPTLAFDVGVASAPQLFNASSTAVGRVAGPSADTTLLPSGRLYKNASGAPLLVLATVHSAAAMAVAGTLEVELTYFIEDLPGSPA